MLHEVIFSNSTAYPGARPGLFGCVTINRPAIICKNKSQENGTFPEIPVAEARLSAILDGMAKKPDQRRAYSYTCGRARRATPKRRDGSRCSRRFGLARKRANALRCSPCR